MRTCPECGAETGERDAFCNYCGASLDPGPPEGGRPQDRRQPGGPDPNRRQPRGDQAAPGGRHGQVGGRGPGQRGPPADPGRRNLLKLGAAGAAGAGLAGLGWLALDDDEPTGATTGTPTATDVTTPDDRSGPDLLAVIAFPTIGIDLFRDYYENFEPVHEVVVPDGLRSSPLPDEVGNPMEEVRGTAPAAGGRHYDEFVDLYEGRWGQSPGVFTAHTYDAVALAILANAAAGQNHGPALRDQMRRVANGPGQEYGPAELVSAVAAAARGEQLRYVGASGPCDFDDRGDPATAIYEVWRFLGGDVVVEDEIEFGGRPGGDRAADGPGGFGRELMVGVLLPSSGDLGQIGEGMIRAGRIPAQQVEGSGLDLTVDLRVEDTQTDPTTGVEAADRLGSAGYPAVVGAASSGVSVPVADVTRGRGMLQCSPSSTTPALSTFDDEGFFFRTAPSDLLQGRAMGEVAADRLGAETASTLHVANDYGRALARAFADAFEGSGGDVYRQVSVEQGQGSYVQPLETALAPPGG